MPPLGGSGWQGAGRRQRHSGGHCCNSWGHSLSQSKVPGKHGSFLIFFDILDHPNRQYAHLCKTEGKELSCCSSKRPYKVGHPWRSVTVPLQAPDPRRHLPLACGSAPGPTSWIWHLCCPSKRDRLVFHSCAGGSGGNYWLNLRHDTGNPTDLKRI